MDVLNVQPQTFRQYGEISEGMAATVAAAGAADITAAIAAAVPVFGLIGQEFLASFACAQVNHFAALAELVESFATTAVTSHAAAQAFELTEQASAQTFTPSADSER
ncbi:type VII secretion target [Nocardia sp. NPDC005366]|uniref:type VII secretion target n=1 Tax=Nocardia sp. NPDC005366 TaxID=3156878 RepID=UPI0033A9A7A8